MRSYTAVAVSCFVLDFRKSHFQNDESVFWLEVLSGHALLTKSSSRVLVESYVKKITLASFDRPFPNV